MHGGIDHVEEYGENEQVGKLQCITQTAHILDLLEKKKQTKKDDGGTFQNGNGHHRNFSVHIPRTRMNDKYFKHSH